METKKKTKTRLLFNSSVIMVILSSSIMVSCNKTYIATDEDLLYDSNINVGMNENGLLTKGSTARPTDDTTWPDLPSGGKNDPCDKGPDMFYEDNFSTNDMYNTNKPSKNIYTVSSPKAQKPDNKKTTQALK